MNRRTGPPSLRRIGPSCSPPGAAIPRAPARLCQTYWYPRCTYVRREGHNPTDAQDLTQEFFARFLETNYLEGRSAERGKFRAFLLASLKHFLANEWDKAQSQKRGGGALHLSLDWQSADERYHLDAPDRTSPDRLDDRDRALAWLERVIARLREECAADGKASCSSRRRIASRQGRRRFRTRKPPRGCS